MSFGAPPQNTSAVELQHLYKIVVDDVLEVSRLRWKNHLGQEDHVINDKLRLLREVWLRKLHEETNKSVPPPLEAAPLAPPPPGPAHLTAPAAKASNKRKEMAHASPSAASAASSSPSPAAGSVAYVKQSLAQSYGVPVNAPVPVKPFDGDTDFIHPTLGVGGATIGAPPTHASQIRVGTQPQTAARGPVTKTIPQKDGPGDDPPSKKSKSGAEEKKKEKKKKDNDDDLFASDDDDDEDLSDEDLSDDGEAEPVTNNSVLAQYEQVKRIKNRWKLKLKEGIVRLNDQEFVFATASGDFAF